MQRRVFSRDFKAEAVKLVRDRGGAGVTGLRGGGANRLRCLKPFDDGHYNAENIRGATPRYWEEVAVGDPLGPFAKGPMTITGFIAYLQGRGGTTW